MGDIGDDFREHKEYLRKQREKKKFDFGGKLTVPKRGEKYQHKTKGLIRTVKGVRAAHQNCFAEVFFTDGKVPLRNFWKLYQPLIEQ